MLRRMCIAKIHRATITACHLDYEGSIQVDQTLMEAAGIFEHEMVLVANLANGERFETYVICGPKDTGVISLNGAASRLGAGCWSGATRADAPHAGVGPRPEKRHTPRRFGSRTCS